jgi:vacuolar protein sorting-associated protein VTA1
VTDSVAANAYVEQFGMEIFNRAETTMNANKVTKSVPTPSSGRRTG